MIPDTHGLTRLHDRHLTAVYRGDYGFDRYLARGGSATEEETFLFLKELLQDPVGLHFRIDGLGCSTVQARGEAGYLFGRNFDWEECPLLTLVSYPDRGYPSITSVNLDFIIKRSADLPADSLLVAAHYAPLDGMNQKGLCVSVNLLPDGMELKQRTGKPALTITTALRLILDQAATVEEALALLRAHDVSTTTGLTIHYLLADAAGRCVCVEYIHNQMTVIDSPVMTNHYLAPGPYFGLARNNSRERYDRLAAFRERCPVANKESLLSAMAEVFRGTQWTALYDQSALTADIYQKDAPDTPLQVRF